MKRNNPLSPFWRVLDDLAKEAPQLREPTNKRGSIDPIGMGIDIGRCDVVKMIYKKMKVDPFDEKKQQFAVKGK